MTGPRTFSKNGQRSPNTRRPASSRPIPARLRTTFLVTDTNVLTNAMGIHRFGADAAGTGRRPVGVPPAGGSILPLRRRQRQGHAPGVAGRGGVGPGPPLLLAGGADAVDQGPPRRRPGTHPPAAGGGGRPLR